MKKMLPLATTLAVILAASPAPADLQGGGTTMAALAGGGPPPPQYVLAADGTLTTGGDVVVNCNEWSAFYEQYSGGRTSDPEVRSDLEGASGVLEECERAGFSPSGGTGADTGSEGPSEVEVGDTPVGGVTEDGFVRTRYDAFVACASGFPVVERYARACAEAGFPPAAVPDPPPVGEGTGGGATLPETGGASVLSPVTAGLLLASSAALVLAARRGTRREDRG